jgi:raffinose/stachyose/melibiose transport system permease protein
MAHSKLLGAQLTSYLYLVPAGFLVFGIALYGIVANFVISTTDWNGVSTDFEHIGLENYQRMVDDPIFWQSLGNTLMFAVMAVGIQMGLGFGLAVLVRTRTAGTALLRTVLFIPVVLSGAVVATSFRELLRPEGSFNQMLRLIGWDNASQPWLADPGSALFVIAAINIWQYTGYSFVIYDAALGQVDQSIIEAARVDGASTLALLALIIAPLLRGSHLILIVLGFIGSLKTFELIFLTTRGGPGTATEFISTYVFRMAITQFDAAYSATLSISLVVVALIFATMQVRLSRADKDS